MRALAFAVAVALVTGCGDGGPDPHLADLRSDPIATAEIPGFTQIDLTEQESGTALGHPSYARLRRTLVTGSPITAEQVAAVAAIARRHGWMLERTGARGWTGGKKVGRTDTSLTITVRETATPQELLIALMSNERVED